MKQELVKQRRRFRLGVQRLALVGILALALAEVALAGGGPVRGVIIALLDELGITSGGVYTPPGGAAPHDLLDGSQNQDTTVGTVARGDFISGQGASATWTRKALGADDTVLASDGTDLAPEALTSVVDSAYSAVDGDLLIGTAGSPTLARLAKGTANQVLGMGTGASRPEWTAGFSESYAGVYLSTSAGAQTITPATPEVLDGTFTEMASSSDWTVSAGGRLTYTGTSNRAFTFTASWSNVISTANKDSIIYIAKDGSIVASTRKDRHHSTNSDLGVSCTSLIDTASQNSYYEIFVDIEGGSTTTTTSYATLVAGTASGMTGPTGPTGPNSGFSLWLPASAFVGAPSDATIPGFTTLATSGHPVLAFDGGTDEDALFRAVMSAGYDSSADLTITFVWTAAGTSQSVEWDIEIAALAGQDIDGAAPAFDTPIAHDGVSNATQGIYTSTTTTNANGLLDGIAASEPFTSRVTRDSSDASAVDSYLIGVLLSQ